MSKHMTIINLACTITKVRKWGEGWKHSAESAYAAFEELQRKHKEAERTIETLRANLTQTEAECQAELAVVKDERDTLRKERDGLLTQVQDMRAKIEQRSKHGAWVKTNDGRTLYVRGYLVRTAPDREELYDGSICTPCDPPEATHDTPEGKQAAESVIRNDRKTEPDEIKVGEYVKNDNGDVCQVHEVYAEYLLNTGWTWAFENCTPCDPPTASHDTPEGKQAAESVIRNDRKTEPDEIKVGDVAKVRSASGNLTAKCDVGQIGEVLKIDSRDGTVLLSGEAGWVDIQDVRKVTT